jgi:hypothetical protein
MIEINDSRDIKQFAKISFSNFEKSKVKKELLNSLKVSKYESCFYWGAELICAGHFIDLWEIIILFMSKHIHIGNPKLPIYLSIKINVFKKLIQNGYNNNELMLRNNEKIRHLFTEILTILCLSRKKHNFEIVKMSKNELQTDVFGLKLKAPNVEYAKPIFKTDDLKEIYIAINEFAYNLSYECRNCFNACYWVEWILELQNVYNKKKETCLIERRKWVPVNLKSQMNLVWIIWDAIIYYANKTNNKITIKIINALLNIYCLKFTTSIINKRKFIIYFAISIITDNIDTNIKICSDENMSLFYIKNIDLIYNSIKKNEIPIKTNYLFNGIEEKTNLEKTIDRLDKINMIMDI